ncbi:hypothetical protein K435DRAFT_970233 [Dendrothele bispora CBS 962.96]|uniref:Uncharacterized protein n=1 Tax=Dendrothele bispora (strain CBS 962.96) TaxID=1314807 RepID=A0A4S8LCH9_DENBC|nr:hypothetical protein K435DRAFT_970233 [Dendrothele bispora CBS 962.96]
MALNALGAYFIAHLVQHAFFAFTTTTTLTATRTRREHFPSEENLEDQDEILSFPSRIDSSRSPSPTQSNQPENLPASPLLSFSPCSTSNSDKLSPSANLETEHPDSPLFPFPQPDTSPSSPTGESAIEDATLKDMSLSPPDSPQTLDTIPGALVHVLDWHTDTILDTVRLFCEYFNITIIYTIAPTKSIQVLPGINSFRVAFKPIRWFSKQLFRPCSDRHIKYCHPFCFESQST